MKPFSSSILITSALSAVFAFAGCSDRETREATAENRPTYVDARGATRNAATSDNAVNRAASDARSAAAATWNDIRSYTYDRRSEFAASMDRMSAKLDAETADWSAKRSTLTGDAATAWDRAAGDLRDAREDLQEQLGKLNNASADNWEKAKAKVASAWERTEAAYLSLKARVAP